jgi:hypothetical protein
LTVILSELGDKHSINDRILMKINEYYENNLRAISVRSLGEQLKAFEGILDTKASQLEVKKLISSICNQYLIVKLCR